jgi:hypothetical protein
LAAIERGESFIAHQLKRLKESRDILCDGLSATGRVSFATPQAALPFLFRHGGAGFSGYGSQACRPSQYRRRSRVGVRKGRCSLRATLFCQGTRTGEGSDAPVLQPAVSAELKDQPWYLLCRVAPDRSGSDFPGLSVSPCYCRFLPLQGSRAGIEYGHL